MKKVTNAHMGRYLRRCRMERKLSQGELAEKLADLHYQYISNWERGICPPPSHRMDDIIKLLKVDRRKLIAAMMEDAKEEIVERVYNKGG